MKTRSIVHRRPTNVPTHLPNPKGKATRYHDSMTAQLRSNQSRKKKLWTGWDANKPIMEELGKGWGPFDKGTTINPVHHHCGPGNSISSVPSKNPVDEACRQHDIKYGEGNAFKGFFSPDKLEADREFITAQEKAGGAGRLYAGVFRAKLAANKLLVEPATKIVRGVKRLFGGSRETEQKPRNDGMDQSSSNVMKPSYQ